MNPETILDAMLKSREEWVSIDLKARLGICPRDIYKDAKFYRQYHAFRARILRVDAEQRNAILTLEHVIRNGDNIVDKKDVEIENLKDDIQFIKDNWGCLLYTSDACLLYTSPSPRDRS